MHITLESDYAVRIVSCLAGAKSARLDAKFIAENTGVPLRFALKILRNLVANGIMKSFKGAQGGYELAKLPSEITLKDVIETVEGTYYLSRCLNSEQNYSCTREHGGNCCYQNAFNEISDLVREKLASYNFEYLENLRNERVSSTDKSD